jgi:hypothetical protein
MKRFVFLLLVMVLVITQSLQGRIVSPFTDLDTYVSHVKTVLICETLPIDEGPIYRDAYRRKVQVLSVLSGSFKKDEIIHVLVDSPLAPGSIYLICSHEDVLNEKEELYACFYEPGVVEIQLWGEISKAEKQARISKFLKEIEGKPLKEQILYIFKMRLRQLENEEKQIKREKDVLEKALK